MVTLGAGADATPARPTVAIRAKTERLRENYMLMSMTMSSCKDHINERHFLAAPSMNICPPPPPPSTCRGSEQLGELK